MTVDDRARQTSDSDDQAWRGVAAESTDRVTAKGTRLLHHRSRALLWSMIRPYRGRFILASILVLANTAMTLAIPLLVGMTIDSAIRPAIGTGRVPAALWGLIAAFGVTIAAEAATNQAFLSVAGRATQDALRDLRVRVFKHFQKLSLSFYERYTSGRVIARMTSDVDAITDLLATGLVDITTSVLSLVGILAALLILDWPLGLATLSVFPFVLLISRWFRRNAERVYRRVRRTVALVIIHFTESLGGIRAVQSFRREPRNQEIMEDVNGQYTDANIESIRLLSIFSPAMTLLGRIATAIVLVYGGWRVLDGSLELGMLISFVLYVRMFFEPMQELSMVYNLLQAAAAALENLAGVLDEEPSVPEPLQPRVPEHVAGRVTFEDVSFGYRDELVLPHVDLEIPAGQTVALVGETGAGKTTIARLVARFWDPSDGRVELDGIDLRDIPDDVLRRNIAMVTQESFLFSGTVADNIALGRPEASRSEIEESARAIGAYDFIAALPDGFDTDVRKRGGRLSAGQRQLVSFARAFLADPAVLILDEATSSLDIPSERLVQHALRTLLADRTALIIAHRLSTVEIADRVLVVDGGHILEDGSPEDLMGGTGAYAALHDAWLESLA